MTIPLSLIRFPKVKLRLKRKKMEEEKENKETEEKAEVSIEVLEERIAAMEEEIRDLKDKSLREAAESENFRKRIRTEKENAVKYANEQLIRDLLDPLDNFSRAIDAAGQTEDVETLKTGVAMVEDQLQSLLKTKYGLEAYDPTGEAFDPSSMEACSLQEKEGLDKDTVLQTFIRGYKLHGKVIRSAKVVVGRAKAD